MKEEAAARLSSPAQRGARRGTQAGLVAVVMLGLIVVGNTFYWREATERYRSIEPRYGQAVKSYMHSQVDRNDRSWSVYRFIQDYFSGWVLVSFRRDVSLASDMYDLPYGGLSQTRIRDYDPDLSEEEQRALVSASVVEARLDRLDGSLNVILPRGPADTSGGVVVLLRHGNQYFFVPRAQAPERFGGLE